MIRLNLNILVGDDTVELRIRMDDRVLADYAVFQYCALFDPHTTENDTVFDGAINHAAIGDQAVFRLALKSV